MISHRCGGRSGGGAAAAAALRGSISVIVWFGQTQALTKNIWHMAICQHQFYLDRRPDSFSKSHHHHLKVPQQQQQPPPRNLNDIALDLSKSSTSLSLSTASNCSSAHSHSNLSHCGSTQTLNKMGHTPRKHPSIAASMPCHPLPLDGRSRPPPFPPCHLALVPGTLTRFPQSFPSRVACRR